MNDIPSHLRDETPPSGGRSYIDNWPEPIFPGEDRRTCPICHNSPMTRPVQVQCGHVLCNPCMQEMMAQDQNESHCPICRALIFEYRSLDSKRIRRPRDKSVPPPRQSPDRPDDPDYQPSLLIAREDGDESPIRSNAVEDLPLMSSQPIDLTMSQAGSQTQQSSGSSVIFLGEFRPSECGSTTQVVEGSSQQAGPSLEMVLFGDSDQDRTDDQPVSQAQFSARRQPFADRTREQGSLGLPLMIAYQQRRNSDQAFVLVDVDKIIAHRGRGRCIRYLVVYSDGQQSWEPIVHLNWCPLALDKYRKAKAVRNQQAYRRRKANAS